MTNYDLIQRGALLGRPPALDAYLNLTLQIDTNTDQQIEASGFIYLLVVLFLLWLDSVGLHLEVTVGHSPEVAGVALYGFLVFESDREIIHSELPSEKHPVVVLALGFYFILHAVVPALRMRMHVFLRLPSQVFWSAQASTDSILGF